jgi:hypothetical protein
MISPKFRDVARKILKIDFDYFQKHLPNSNAGTKVRSILKELKITDIGGVLCMSRSDIAGRRGFGMETATALEEALDKLNRKLGMLPEDQ